MAGKVTEWPSNRGPISKIWPSDGCKGDTVPLAVGMGYFFHGFGWYPGNVGSDDWTAGPRAWPSKRRWELRRRGGSDL